MSNCSKLPIVLIAAVLTSVHLLFTISAIPAEKANQVDVPSNGFVCGTYPGRVYDELRKHRINVARLQSQTFKKLTTVSRDVGDIAVIEDDGSLVAVPPFLSAFDLDGLKMHFSPNGSGGYDVSFVTFSFDTQLGTNVNAGDDTNHEITFSGGFTFSFFGTTWTDVWIRSNGDVTFGGIGNPDFFDPDDIFLELPMIAAFFADLNPAASGSVFFRQEADRFVVTWDGITEFGANNSNTIQLTLFADGSFDIAYNGVDTQVDAIVGFNSGNPDPLFEEVDFSAKPVTDSSAEMLFEVFEEITFRRVDIAAVAQKFYETHPDDFDQLVMITHFDIPGADFTAFHAGVRNDVEGIGRGIFDETAPFGSQGRLQSYLHMNYLDLWPDDPAEELAPTFSFLNVLGQEAGHRWLAFLRFDDNGTPSELLLGRALAHWSFFLDSDASTEEGNDWRDNYDGSFTSVRAGDDFSMLDHYAMGLRAPEEVSPFFYIDVPGVTQSDRSRGPSRGAVAFGPKRWVVTQDVINFEGARIPGRQNSQKDFRQAFILLTLQGVQPTAQDIAKAENFREAWEDWFAEHTDGRATTNTRLAVDRPVAVVEGTVFDASTNEAVANLLVNHKESNIFQPVPADGYYQFRLLADSIAQPAETATLVFDAYPYFPDSTSTSLSFGSTSLQDVFLTKLPTSTISGTITNADGSIPVQADITLYVSSTAVEPFRLVQTTDVNGDFAFTDLPITYPEIVAYDSLVVEPELPFVGIALTDITLVEATPIDLSLNLQTIDADLLLVNDDANGEFSEFYTSALDNLDVTYFQWTTLTAGAVPTSELSFLNQNAIIWFTGSSATDVLTVAEQDSISAFLNSGGNVFLTGQNVAEYLNSTQSPFLENVLHVSWSLNVPASERTLHGIQDDPIGGGLTKIRISSLPGGAANQDSPDEILPDAIANTAIVYDTVANNAAGVWVEDVTTGSRLVFFSFGFEAITNAIGDAVTREQVLVNVLSFFQIPVTSVEERIADLGIPGEFSLSPNYPNPFNPTTTISFAVPLRSSVNLRIYSLLGQEVKVLIDGEKDPGYYRIEWDGRNEAGQTVGSGVYFYRVEAIPLGGRTTGFVQVRKMLLLK